jgi:osmotically-inducible protein OsmY
MKLLLALILGAVLGAGALWFFSTKSGQQSARGAGEQVEAVTKSGYAALQEKIKEWNLRPQDIKEELAKSGQVVRRKAEQAGQAVADATSDARITATIKGKFVAERGLPAMSISVNTTEGIVTLSGAVEAADDISRTMALAMEVEGVREVISTMQVRGTTPSVTRKGSPSTTNDAPASK